MREIQVTMRAEAERRLDRYDELALAAWIGADLERHKRLPKPERVLAKRLAKRRAMTMEQDIARMERFFRSVSKGKPN